MCENDRCAPDNTWVAWKASPLGNKPLPGTFRLNTYVACRTKLYPKSTRLNCKTSKPAMQADSSNAPAQKKNLETTKIGADWFPGAVYRYTKPASQLPYHAGDKMTHHITQLIR